MGRNVTNKRKRKDKAIAKRITSNINVCKCFWCSKQLKDNEIIRENYGCFCSHTCSMYYYEDMIDFY